MGSITAFFAATSGLVQNDIKRIVAFSTISQLGYMVAAIGLSQYNVALFHLVNHAFFVRQHRYLNLDFNTLHATVNVFESHFKWYDGPSFRNLLKKGITTNISFEFKLNLRWERLMKMNFRQNCIIMIKIVYSRLYILALEKFIMKKINEGSQVMSRCRIEKISSPYFGIFTILMKIVQILKVGKPVNLFTFASIPYLQRPLIIQLGYKASKYFLLFLPLFYIRIVNNTIQSGCRIGYQANELLNRNYRLNLINSQECSISHSSYKKKNEIATAKLIFKKECKEIFKLNKSLDKILFELKIKIPKWIKILGKSNYFLSFIKNYIYNRGFIWMIKKHKGVGKKLLYSKYFEPVPYGCKENFSALKTNKDILKYSQNNLNNGFKLTNEENDSLQDQKNKDNTPQARSGKKSNQVQIFNFDLARSDLKFINVEKEFNNIINLLNKLDNSNKSGIYLF